MSQHFVLRKGNQFFDKDGKFKAPAALDQAEALGLHLDTIRVMPVRKAD